MMDIDVTFPERSLQTRRDLLVKGIAGALVLGGYGSRGGVVLANTPGVSHGESPGVTEGPYWVDGQPARVDVRSDSTTGVYQAGMPVYLGLTISQLSDTAPYTITPLKNARIDIWCANAQGVYSDESVENTSSVNYLRGYQTTNSHGVVNFLTLYPGWYSGRTPHIHIRIRAYNGAGTVIYNFTSQLFFDETITKQIFSSVAAYSRTQTQDTYNATDNVYTGSSANSSPATEAGDYLMMKMAAGSTHVMGSFHFVVDLSDTGNADATNGASGGTGTGGGGTPPTGGGGTPPGGGSARSSSVTLSTKTSTGTTAKSKGTASSSAKTSTKRTSN